MASKKASTTRIAKDQAGVEQQAEGEEQMESDTTGFGIGIPQRPSLVGALGQGLSFNPQPDPPGFKPATPSVIAPEI